MFSLSYSKVAPKMYVMFSSSISNYSQIQKIAYMSYFRATAHDQKRGAHELSVQRDKPLALKAGIVRA